MAEDERTLLLKTILQGQRDLRDEMRDHNERHERDIGELKDEVSSLKTELREHKTKLTGLVSIMALTITAAGNLLVKKLWGG